MIKQMAGRVSTLLRPQCRFDRAVFLLGHMRSGSTALSNVLCGHPDISGYGEAHIAYDRLAALGILSLNQQRRRALRRDARYLFDKVLHSRYDASPTPEFYDARAIFLIREPVATILSIRNLFRKLSSSEYTTDALAADYYEERVSALMAAWDRFPPARRIGFSHAQLTARPEAALAGISVMLALDPPLANRYVGPGTAMPRGAGDPLAAHHFSGIANAKQASAAAQDLRPLDIPKARHDYLNKLFAAACKTVTQA